VNEFRLINERTNELFGLGLISIACIVFIMCAVYVTKDMNFIDTRCRQSYLYVIKVAFCQLVQ